MIDSRTAASSGALTASVLLLALAGATAAAQEPGTREPTAAGRDLPDVAMADRPPYRLVYDHLTGRTRLFTPKGELRGEWRLRADSPVAEGSDSRRAFRRGAPVAPIPPDHPLAIEIENANALLYEYDVNVVPVRAMNVRTCRAVGGEFLQRGFLASVAATRGMTATVEIPDTLLSAARFTAALSAPGAAGRSRGGGMTEAQWQRTRESVERLITFASDLEAVTRFAQGALPQVAELGEAQPIDTLLRELQNSVARRFNGLRSSRRVAQMVHEELARAQPDIAVVVEHAASGPSADGADSFAAPAAALKTRLEVMLQQLTPTYRRLQIALAQIDRARELSEQSFVVGPSGDLRRISLALRATDDFKDAPRTAPGSVDFYAHPVVRVNCQLSIGIAYMAQPARYGEEGGLAVDSREEGARTTAAVMLHLSPNSWGPLAGLLGIGLGVNKSPDLYLGGSFRLLPNVAVNGGAVWQREQHLPGNLAPPNQVTAAELDRLPRSYSAGWFGGLSISP